LKIGWIDERESGGGTGNGWILVFHKVDKGSLASLSHGSDAIAEAYSVKDWRTEQASIEIFCAQ